MSILINLYQEIAKIILEDSQPRQEETAHLYIRKTPEFEVGEVILEASPALIQAMNAKLGELGVADKIRAGEKSIRFEFNRVELTDRLVKLLESELPKVEISVEKTEMTV